MIIDMYHNEMERFFHTTDENTVFVCGFSLLYQYKKSALKKFKDWPLVCRTINKKDFESNTCHLFESKKNKLGTLIILSHKVSEIVFDDKATDDYIVILTQCLNEVKYPDKLSIFRIDFPSLPGAFIDKTAFKLMSVFAKSEKKFEIYRNGFLL